MVKRIVSGIFILTALGALGVILAGAMTSGEQLIVRFLTAVTVAALALYVISDLRLQNEQEDSPADRGRLATDRSTAQTAGTTRKGRAVNGAERRGRQSGDTSIQPVPTFEAIETVTARPQAAVHTDPTQAVTGSRLVPPTPEQIDRLVPPHPVEARTEASGNRTASPTAVPPPPPTNPGEGRLDGSLGTVSTDATGDVVDGLVEPATGMARTGKADDRGDRRSVFVIPPDERPGASSDSVIATTSFTYSGKVDSSGVEWPPKPPVFEQAFEKETGDDPATVGAIDEPTAELPALPEHRSDDDSQMEASAVGVDDDETDDETGTAPAAPTVHLFAVDTAELPLIETLEPVSVEDDSPSVFALAISGDRSGEHESAPLAEADPAAARPLIRRIEVADSADPSRTGDLDLREPVGAVPTDDADRSVPAVPTIGGRLPEKLTAAIRSGEIQVINSLISQGMLTTSGPITDRDVRTMVYVAFTSNELRKLIIAGGTPDGVRAGDLDLGEVELFDESRFAPPPKLLYAGPPPLPEAPPEPIIDLVALENESAVVEAPASDVDYEVGDADLVHTLPTPKHLYRRPDADRVER